MRSVYMIIRRVCMENTVRVQLFLHESKFFW